MKAALAALLLALAGPELAQAKPTFRPIEPPADIWAIETDSAFAPAQTGGRYIPPRPVRGFAAHGVFGYPAIAPGFDARVWQTCNWPAWEYNRIPDPAGQEFWYYQSGNRALLLIREQTLIGAEGCKPQFRHTMLLYRFVLGADNDKLARLESDRTYTIWSRGKAGPSAEPLEQPEGWDLLAELLLRRQVEINRGKAAARLGQVPIRCQQRQGSVDSGSGRCFSVAKGPSRGFITSEYAVDVGEWVFRFDLIDLKDNVLIDARLFEWDRRIDLKAAP